MVESLGEARAGAAKLRCESQQARAQAWTDFEAAVSAAEDTTEAAEMITDVS